MDTQERQTQTDLEFAQSIQDKWVQAGQMGLDSTLPNSGLQLTHAYHCNRCDYLWFPKDFDVIGKDRTIRNIFNLIPPKSCARCKSKYWREPRKRTRKLPPPPPGRKPLPDDGMITLPRIRAFKRNMKRLTAQMETLEKQIPIPIPIQTRRKKKSIS